jgi:glycosyltransferase involved in cell wall biosynthesis
VTRQAVVIHDIAPLVHPEYFARSYAIAARTLLPRLVQSCGVLMTTSAFNQQELTRRFPDAEDKIVVVGAGVDHETFSPRAEDPRRELFALFVGAHDRRKNLAFLTEFWPEVWRRSGMTLVCTERSAARVTHASARVGNAPWLSRVVDPSDAELGSLYARAEVLLCPSRYEGFGLPLLEAACAGTPFISTATGAALELAVRPWQIQPLEREAWLAALAGLGGDPVMRQELVELAGRFTWQDTAERISRAVSTL